MTGVRRKRVLLWHDIAGARDVVLDDRAFNGAAGAAVRAVIALAALIDPVCAKPTTPTPGIDQVIELFTSQGCPRCPAADRLITDLAHAPRTIALSYPVTTWDFAGWHDTLASPVSTQRQEAYAAARGDRLVFTPQVIVDGVAVEPGADKAAILRDTGMLVSGGDAFKVSLDLSETGGTLHVKLGAGSTKGGPASVYVLRVAGTKTVQIDRGANSGRSVTYTNVVRAMSRLGEWTGAPESFDVFELKSDDEGYVVLLQAGTPERPGAILAAAKTAGL